MMNRTAVLIVLSAGLVGSARAADPWDRVMRLKPRDAVRVTSVSADTHTQAWLTGEFRSASPDAVVLIVDRKEVTEIKREDVRRVELLREESTVRHALPYIGFAAGVSIGYLAGRNLHKSPPSSPGLFPSFRISRPVARAIFGIAGAGVGGGLGIWASHDPDTFIYRAPPGVK